jgi:hypothetical protein
MRITSVGLGPWFLGFTTITVCTRSFFDTVTAADRLGAFFALPSAATDRI